MSKRTIPLEAHNAMVLAFAPLMMVGPYLLTFSPAVGLISFFLGALAMGGALANSAKVLPVSTHEGFNWVLGLSTFGIGIVAGIVGQVPVAAIFLVGFGAAHLALIASTRFSARGA
ncbi:MAG: hypothetical protein WBW62_00350 [Solirubrobacterales bacterium]